MHRRLSAAAAAELKAHNITNVTLEVGVAAQGYAAHAPYEVIAVTGSMPVLAPDLKKSLKLGGRLFVVVGDSPVMEAKLITRVGEDEWAVEDVFETDLPPLQNAAQPQRFKF